MGSRSVRVDLGVPAQLKAEVRTGDGNVVAQGLKGELRLKTADGSIEAESVDGLLAARTTDGKVTARGRFVSRQDRSRSAVAPPGMAEGRSIGTPPTETTSAAS